MTKKQAAKRIINLGGQCESVRCQDCFLPYRSAPECDRTESEVYIAAVEFLKSGNVYASGYQPTRPPAGRKDDMGKTKMELLPFNALVKVADVLSYGASKYGANNWQGVEAQRYVGALLRHLAAYMEGEENDAESGRSHLAHLATNALFLLSKRETAKKAEAYENEVREKMK